MRYSTDTSVSLGYLSVILALEQGGGFLGAQTQRDANAELGCCTNQWGNSSCLVYTASESCVLFHTQRGDIACVDLQGNIIDQF